MNKEKLEEMILEELINEARNDRTVNNMPDNYKETARGTFGDMVDDEETLKTIWLHYGPKVIHYTGNIGHKKKLRALGGNDQEIDKEDFEKLKQTAQTNPGIASLDDLLAAAAGGSPETSDSSSTETSGEAEISKITKNQILKVNPHTARSGAIKGFNIVLKADIPEQIQNQISSNSEGSGVSKDSERVIRVKFPATVTLYSNNTQKFLKTILKDDAISFVHMQKIGDSNTRFKSLILSLGNESEDEEVADSPDEESPEEEEEVDPNLFVPTDGVNSQIEKMKEFYDQPYLYLQGKILRDTIKELQNAMKEEETTAGITRDTTSLEEEKKGLNVKNIKASLNAFLQQTRKVKKALEEYIKMAEKGKMGATRKKGILDKEVDRLIDYGKSIIKSLPKPISEATEETEEATSEEGISLQPLHKFVNFVVGENAFDAIQKEKVQDEINKVQPVLKVFPNVAPFGQAQDLDINLEDYSKKFQAAINDHLKSAIANFKSLQSDDGGEAAIKGLRTALIEFLATGLSILGKSVDGNDLKDLGTDEAIDSEDDVAEVSDLSPEKIMAELGLDTSDEGKITTTSDEEKAMNALGWILNKLSTNKRYNTPKEISDFIYDQVQYKRGVLTGSKEFVKGILRAIGARKFIPEAQENNFDIEEFAQKFVSEIVKMSTNYRSSKDKEQLRQASNALTQEVFNAFKEYKKIKKPDPTDPSRIITNTDKTVTDMFKEISSKIGTFAPASIKYKKVLYHMEKNIDKMTTELLIKTLKKMNPSKIQDSNDFSIRIKTLSEKILKKDPKTYNENEVLHIELDDNNKFKLATNNITVDLNDDFEMTGLKSPPIEESKNQQIEFKLEKLVENYINKRKQQWRKRTM